MHKTVSPTPSVDFYVSEYNPFVSRTEGEHMAEILEGRGCSALTLMGMPKWLGPQDIAEVFGGDTTQSYKVCQPPTSTSGRVSG